jgi:hypothetical protein
MVWYQLQYRPSSARTADEASSCISIARRRHNCVLVWPWLQGQLLEPWRVPQWDLRVPLEPVWALAWTYMQQIALPERLLWRWCVPQWYVCV